MSPKKYPTLKSKLNGIKAQTRKMRFTRKRVLKMLAVTRAVMDSSQHPSTQEADKPPATPGTEELRPDDFLQSGRTGRRNALANILSEHANVTSSDLPSQLAALTTDDKPEKANGDEPSTSKS